MITFGWYILKVIICSGILYGYYQLTLRNKMFHQWNRFYLLASVTIALIFPIIKINIFQQSMQDDGTVVKMLQTINSGDNIVIEYSRHNGLQLSAESIVWSLYMLVTILLLTVFLLALFKIYKLKKKYPAVLMQDILFVATDAKGTPFSFFKSIFWNNAIDLGSLQGQQIFNHEIVHIREKHSYDKVFINLVLLPFWINPFFWLMRRELNMIHEFIADRKSVENDDSSAFAAMLLQTVYPGQALPLTNNFFHSPLKRRLNMFTKNHNRKVSYISRLVVLPLVAIIFFAFTIKMKIIHNFTGYSGKKITVVIDAGHGGKDNGAVENNVLEKNIDLAIAKDIANLNKNEDLNIVLTRTGDEYIDPLERTDFAAENNADVFISIHTDADPSDNSKNGVTVMIPKNGVNYLPQSKLLGSAIIQSCENNIALFVNTKLQQREKNIWVVNNNFCPSILLEAGFLTNQKDLEYISNPANQKIIARNILNGIETYANQIPGASREGLSDTPSPKTVGSGFFADTRHKIIIPFDKEIVTTNPENTVVDPTKAIIIINDKIEPNNILRTKTIKAGTLTIHSGTEQDMINKYGEQAKYGVFVLDDATIKDVPPVYPEPSPSADTINDKIFTKVEHDAQFPGGSSAWISYITTKIQDSANVFTQQDYGTCYLRFIVNSDGTVRNVEPTTMKNTRLASVAVNAIRTGPKWIPATQNGRTVASYRMQPVTVTEPKDK